MKLFNDELFDALTAEAKASPRRRANHNIHESLDAPVQRLFIAIEPGSYVQPHRHAEAEKWEYFLIMRGKLAALIFNEQGKVEQRHVLTPDGPIHGFELPPNTWHTILALEPGSLFVEVKQGPYTPLSDKGFATWAPKEGDPACGQFMLWLAQAQTGDVPPIVA